MLKKLIGLSLCAVLFSSITFAAPPLKPESERAALSPTAISSVRANEEGIIALRQRDYAGAELKFKRSIDLDDHNITAAYNLAGVLITTKRTSEAINLLTRYSELAPQDAGIKARLGDAYFSSKEIGKAAAAYEAALKIDPDYLKIYEKLGTCLTLAKRTRDAESAFAKAHQAFPNDSVILSNLAAVQLTNGHLEMAVQSAESSINLKPSAEAYATLSAAQDALGHKEAAVVAYKKSKALQGSK